MAMNEADTRAVIIDKHLTAKGWEYPYLKREYPISIGRIQSDGKRGKKLSADYVFEKDNQILAVMEAKRSGLNVTEGINQAIKYAELLQAPTAYATNGHDLYKIDMKTDKQGAISWDDFPTPDDMWHQYYNPQTKLYHDLCAVPFENAGEKWTPRYYQNNAIDAVLKAISENKTRILLTLATGTGKTAIAAQIAHKLYTVKWTASGHTRTPRILFLADRNILADQAYNEFSIFGDDARVRINTESIRKDSGELPTNGAVFFTIFQTFMIGQDTENEQHLQQTEYNFHQYAPDFFDAIFIDECHRGGARDESTWRQILEYFAPAVQIGLTATPKRDVNGDTYAYFGDPVYTYTLKNGIADGFLTPYKLYQFDSNINTYKHHINNLVKQGDIDPDEDITAYRLATDVYIEQREQQRVQQFLDLINPNDKTLVFCGRSQRAGIIRDIINRLYPTPNASYCKRVTASDGKDGEMYLDQFKDNEKLRPTILTTSHKLSTGIDARNIRNIVILRPVESMIEFKQIMGRGTRLYDDKAFFTVYDFEGAYKHFQDPEWDGEPLPVSSPRPVNPQSIDDSEPSIEDTIPDPTLDPTPEKQTVIIRLSDENARNIEFLYALSYINADGKLESTQHIINRLCTTIRHKCPTEEDLRKWWQDTQKRTQFLKYIQQQDFENAVLRDIIHSISQQKIDIFDAFAHIAFGSDIKTRTQRRKNVTLQTAPEVQDFIIFVLQQYEKSDDISMPTEVSDLLTLKYGSTHDGIRHLGGADKIKHIFSEISRKIYQS